MNNKLSNYYIDKSDSYESILSELINAGWSYQSDVKMEDKVLICIIRSTQKDKPSDDFDFNFSVDMLQDCLLHYDSYSSRQTLISELKSQFVEKFWDFVEEDLQEIYQRNQDKKPITYTTRCDDLDLHRAMAKSFNLYETDYT